MSTTPQTRDERAVAAFVRRGVRVGSAQGNRPRGRVRLLAQATVRAALKASLGPRGSDPVTEG